MAIHSPGALSGTLRCIVHGLATTGSRRKRIIRREAWMTGGEERLRCTVSALFSQFSILNSAVGGSFVKATVTVELKSGVLDPQGKAIQHSLEALGFSGVEDVRVGKLFRITLKDGTANREELESQVRQMSEKLLANLIVENYSVRIED
jgi:phosphoribosylformylglycinamidine synthase